MRDKGIEETECTLWMSYARFDVSLQNEYEALRPREFIK